jgi:hypothetical protein
MNNKLVRIGLQSGMLNYVDNETPTHYFIASWATEVELQDFAELVARECIEVIRDMEKTPAGFIQPKNAYAYENGILHHFGIK